MTPALPEDPVPEEVDPEAVPDPVVLPVDALEDAPESLPDPDPEPASAEELEPPDEVDDEPEPVVDRESVL
ncbi:hypothetical protein GCM10022199_10830 [Marihabitans asiaticum]|uniref:Uncharacterized protein n=1 Tax=Marihabitans asiaticum TaxID=415218 RepID=A0A560WHR4_9MICO|nr:hypothetical protein FB557_0660 [Marihabitans asiaticum]